MDRENQSVDMDLRLAVKCCLPTDRPESSVNAMADAIYALLTEKRITGLQDLLDRKEAVEEVSIHRTNPYPHICLRLLFQLAQLAIDLRQRRNSSEFVEYGMWKFVDLSGGNMLNPMEKLNEILNAARQDGMDVADVQLRRRNLRVAIDGGLGRSTWRQTVMEESAMSVSDGQEMASLHERTPIEASVSPPREGGSPDRSTPSPSSVTDSDQATVANGEASASGSNADAGSEVQTSHL